MISVLVADSARRHAMGAAARVLVERQFSIAAVVDQLTGLYGTAAPPVVKARR